MADRGDEAWEEAIRHPDDLVRGGGTPGFAARLDRWMAEARVDEAALQRSRERWLREVAEQEATFTGVLVDLAERHAGVTIDVAGRRHHGMIDGIGLDFVAVRPLAGSTVLLRTAAVELVRTAPTVEPALGDRMVATELRLADVLAELAVDRERVRLVTVSGTTVVGVLRSIGHDVAMLRTDGDPSRLAYVPLATVVEVTIG